MKISMLLNPGFSFFGIWDVKWYGVIMAFAMLMGIVAAIFTCKAKGYDKSIILDLAITILPLALVGARLYYCMFYGVDTFWDIFKVWEGGMAIYGGVIGGIIGVFIVSLVKKVPFLDLCDIAAPCLILGQAIGRWGNFVNQEAYGSLITNPNMQWFPMGVYIDSSNFTSAAQSQIVEAFGSTVGVEGAWFNATFFYESFWNIIGFVVLMIICHKVKITGVTTACYFVYYGIGRAVIEGFRTDSLYLWGSNIRVSQALSILLIVGGIVMLTLIVIYNKKHPKQAVQTAEGAIQASTDTSDSAEGCAPSQQQDVKENNIKVQNQERQTDNVEQEKQPKPKQTQPESYNNTTKTKQQKSTTTKSKTKSNSNKK